MINFANPAVVVTMIAATVVVLRVLWALTERLAPKPASSEEE